MSEISASAPGRVNLLGEHTDYNGGYVLPTSIPQRTRVTLSLDAPARMVEVFSENLKQTVKFALGEEQKRGDWSDYVAGVTWALARRGHAVPGFRARIASDVPLGAGLSSSAALELALLRALREAAGLTVDDVQLALIGREAENGFVGAPVGVMDQMASSLCGDGEVLFLDTKTMHFEKLSLPHGFELLVIDSGFAHQHATGDYKTRKAECEQACAVLGVSSLREVESLDALARLPGVLMRRARHVLTENARVLESVRALREGRADELGALFDESHASQRDDYECSLPQVDRLVELTRKQQGVKGARLTGGGFGGSIVALVEMGAAREAGKAAVAEFNALEHRARVLVPREA